MSSGSIGKLVGSRVARVEDDRILTGRGRYVDDVALPGMLHGAFLRSSVAHARIARIDTEAASALPGVAVVLTADDLAAVAAPLDFDFGIDGHRPPPYTALARDKVRFVGDPIAFVVAQTRYAAEDALELIDVEYDELPPVVTVDQALAEGAPTVFDALGDNVIHRDPPGAYDYGDVEGAFARADRVVSEVFRQHRYGLVPMETRGGVAAFDPGTGELTYYATTQSPHLLRVYLSRFIHHPLHQVRVICGDVGGAFGFKWSIYREDVVLAAASRILGRPVKWIEDRSENLIAGGSAREDTVEVDAAVSADGTILGLRVAMTMNHGAYPAMPPSPVFAGLVRCTILSALRVSNFSFATTVVATNKNPYISYRGPGASETLVRERLMDIVAAELGIDPVAVRRKNLVPRSEQPTTMATGATIGRASALETLDHGLGLFDYEQFREEQRNGRLNGRYLGLGIANSIQPTPAYPDWWETLGFPLEKEPARLRLEPDGHVTIITSQMPNGQGHETTLAQVAADELGVPFDHIRVLTGDTQLSHFFLFGTGASRAANMASGSVLAASRELKRRILELAAHLLEVAAEDLEVVGGVVSLKGVPTRSVTVEELAKRVYFEADGLPDHLGDRLDVTRSYRPGDEQGGWAATTHFCWVDVDLDTGFVRIPRYLVVEDCGRMINPAIVEGQIVGGIVQGIGGMLLEHAAYDDQGQFLAGTFQSYLVPTAMEAPEIEIHHLETGAADEGGSFLGVGEGGAIIAPAALTNAIEDALRPLGVRVNTFPLVPTRILELVGTIPVEPNGRSSLLPSEGHSRAPPPALCGRHGFRLDDR